MSTVEAKALILIPTLLMAAVVLPVFRLPAAQVGVEYESGPIAPGAVMGCTQGMPVYRLIEGRLPEGLVLRPAGGVAGRARHAGEYQMTLEVDNGCGRALLPAVVSVRGRALLAVFDTEVELSLDAGDQKEAEAVVRVYADRPGLAYTAEASEPWLRVRPLRGRTPEPGDALAADLLSITVDREKLASGANPDGPRQAKVRLSCFACRGTQIHVVLR